jgi:capsular polysaccharide biosynthesis protein
VAEVASSDILVGPHGAGLMHLLFLPDWACVVELQLDGTGSRLHYANLAAWPRA